MGGVSSEVIIKQERRPCYVKKPNTNKGDVKGMFHCWVKEKGQTMYSPEVTKALVEYENGTMHKVMPEVVRFVDGGDFDKTCFSE